MGGAQPVVSDSSRGASSDASSNNIPQSPQSVNSGKSTEAVAEENSEAAVDGKTFVQSSGQVIEPQKVATIKGSETTIKAADGKVIEKLAKLKQQEKILQELHGAGKSLTKEAGRPGGNHL